MKIDTKTMLRILYVFSWIIFVGVCIEAGGFLFNTFYSMFINPIGSKYYWEQMDLSSLYNYDRGYFAIITLLMGLVAIMRSMIFYHIVKILNDKKLTIDQPFNNEVRIFINRLAYLALGIGFLSWCTVKHIEWLATKGVTMPGIQTLRVAGADVWLFMGVVLLVLAQIFKRGIELQTENDLTI